MSIRVEEEITCSEKNNFRLDSVYAQVFGKQLNPEVLPEKKQYYFSLKMILPSDTSRSNVRAPFGFLV